MREPHVTIPDTCGMNYMLSNRDFIVCVLQTSTQGGSVVKSTDCSSRGPRFNSQHPHGGSQLSVAPVPEDPASPVNVHHDEFQGWGETQW